MYVKFELKIKKMENKEVNTTDEGKIAGVVSYLWLIGWLVAYFGMHKENKTELGSYQLRQTLLLSILSILVGWSFSIAASVLYEATGIYSLKYITLLMQIVFFALWIIGFMGAINGQKKPMPFIGEWAQKLFPNI